MTPSAVKKIEIQKSVFDLDSFQEVLLVKEIDFSPVASNDEALSRLGNDSQKFLSIINEGLRAEAQREARKNPEGWNQETDDGVVPFGGTIADTKAVNSLVLTLAKTTYGYNKEASPEKKKAAKDKAMALIANTPDIKQGLQNNAALEAGE